MKNYYAQRADGREIARVTLDWNPDEDEHYALIEQLVVRANDRGQGHARALMRRVLADADREGVELQLMPWRLERSTSLERLIAFYRSLGFTPIAAGRLRRAPGGVARRLR